MGEWSVESERVSRARAEKSTTSSSDDEFFPLSFTVVERESMVSWVCV